MIFLPWVLEALTFYPPNKGLVSSHRRYGCWLRSCPQISFLRQILLTHQINLGQNQPRPLVHPDSSAFHSQVTFSPRILSCIFMAVSDVVGGALSENNVYSVKKTFLPWPLEFPQTPTVSSLCLRNSEFHSCSGTTGLRDVEDTKVALTYPFIFTWYLL